MSLRANRQFSRIITAVCSALWWAGWRVSEHVQTSSRIWRTAMRLDAPGHRRLAQARSFRVYHTGAETNALVTLINLGMEGYVVRGGARLGILYVEAGISQRSTNGRTWYQSRRCRVDAVDRIGAGDAFSGALIYGLLAKLDMQHAVGLAVAVSCLTHTVRGDFNLASLAEVEALLGENP